jgi:uncharacterized protein (DUF2267 family)
MRKLTAIATTLAALALPAGAGAQVRHRHDHKHHHARKQAAHRATAPLEYFPVLEEWLTPEEARAVREFEAELPRLVAEVEGELAAAEGEEVTATG